MTASDVGDSCACVRQIVCGPIAPLQLCRAALGLLRNLCVLAVGTPELFVQSLNVVTSVLTRDP
jgi:hypothetical protein